MHNVSVTFCLLQLVLLANESMQIQPPILPRPDLKALGINYRRIPLMAIGKDVYCDTRLILLKLERMFPSGTLGASQPDQRALTKLLEIWTVDGGVFNRAAQLIPSSMPLLKDEKFVLDRKDFSGRSWKKDDIENARPEAIAHIRGWFGFLEATLLADDREWILKTGEPSLADIEGMKFTLSPTHTFWTRLTQVPAVWVFDWLIGLKGALPRDLISEKHYPKVFAWVERFNTAMKAARSAGPKPTTLKGDAALYRITHADFAEDYTTVDEQDPLGLKKGQEVEIWPTDSGSGHRDRGTLVGLTEVEVVVVVRSEEEGKEIRLHCPRTNFRIRAVNGGAAPKL